MSTSLKKKIMYMYSVLWASFLILLIFSFGFALSIQLDRQAVERLKSQSYLNQSYAARSISVSNRNDNENSLKNYATYLAKHIYARNGMRVQIYLADKLLSDYGGTVDVPFTNDVKVAMDKKAYKFFYLNGVKCISFSSPILDFSNVEIGKSIGVIRCIYPMKDEREFFIKVIGIIILLAIGMLVINLFLSHRFAREITSSVNSLKNSAILMQNGNLNNPISVKSDDEIEELGYTFELMRKRLKEYIEKLDTRSKQMQQFYNNVAHQLKTPLTSIIGYSQMIQLSTNLDEICEDAFIIEEEGEKLLNSIEIVLQGAREDMQWGVLHISEFEVKDLVSECLKVIKPRLDKLKIKANDLSTSSLLNTDRDILKEILLTLIDNAIIHSGCQTLSIFNEKEGEDLLLHVKDDGVGIESEDRDMIFEAFFQGSESAGKGTGLGLSICLGLAKKIKGKLWLCRDTEKGTEFIIKIPRISL